MPNNPNPPEPISQMYKSQTPKPPSKYYGQCISYQVSDQGYIPGCVFAMIWNCFMRAGRATVKRNGSMGQLLPRHEFIWWRTRRDRHRASASVQVPRWHERWSSDMQWCFACNVCLRFVAPMTIFKRKVRPKRPREEAPKVIHLHPFWVHFG